MEAEPGIEPRYTALQVAAEFLLATTKSCGINPVRKRRNRLLSSLLLVSLWTSGALAADCSDYEASVDAGRITPLLFEEMEKSAVRGDLCVKNLIGKIFALGKGGVSQDWERAYAIFNELSDAGYAPAQFNLALLLAEKDDLDLEAFLSFAVGLITKYSQSRDYIHVSRGAADLGTFVLRERIKSNENDQAKVVRLNQYLIDFEFAVAKAAHSGAVKILRDESDGHDRNNTIAAILSLGLAIHNAARVPSYGPGAGAGYGPAPAWMNYKGIIGPSSLYRAPAWRSYSGIIGPNILYKIR